MTRERKEKEEGKERRKREGLWYRRGEEVKGKDKRRRGGEWRRGE